MAPPSKSSADSVAESVTREIEATGASASQISASMESSKLSGTLMEIDDWIEKTLKERGTYRPRSTVRISLSPLEQARRNSTSG